jgi:hypothetical protein
MYRSRSEFERGKRFTVRIKSEGLGMLHDLDATSRTARPKWRSRRSRPEDIPRMIMLFRMIRGASDAVNGGIRDPVP